MRAISRARRVAIEVSAAAAIIGCGFLATLARGEGGPIEPIAAEQTTKSTGVVWAIKTTVSDGDQIMGALRYPKDFDSEESCKAFLAAGGDQDFIDANLEVTHALVASGIDAPKLTFECATPGQSL